MKSKYVDIPAINNIIGCIFKDPSLFDNEKYKFNDEDFYDSFHKIIFGSMYNLWQLGAAEISLVTIEDYLSTRPKAKAEYDVNKGAEFILKCAENSDSNTLPYYYNRTKKFSLFRAYEKLGLNLTGFYDPDTFDIKKKEKQENMFDNTSIEDIADKINSKIEAIKEKYVQNSETAGCQIGTNIDELLAGFEKAPDIGYPLYGKYINTITRGARLGKFFLRSAATNVGKTRSMIADACYIGCSLIYDIYSQDWIETGAAEPTLFIATEQDLSEIQTMALAFISGVEEDHITLNQYEEGEPARIKKAVQILKMSMLHFICLSDFSTVDIENTIKSYIREKGVKYVFFDYIHSSAKILSDIGGKAGIKGLREDNVLFLLSSALKDIAVKYEIFILSSTQLNSDYRESDTPDQNLLRGSKAMADRVDWGAIMLEVTPSDHDRLEQFCKQKGIEMPNVKMSIYKNRANKWKGIYLWMYANRGICRFESVFVTDWRLNIVEMDDFKIRVSKELRF